MYWVLWNTRKANPARKSREDNSPATGRSVKPVESKKIENHSPHHGYRTENCLIRINTDNLKSTIGCSLKKSLTFQEVGNIFKLRYIVFSIAAILNEQRKNVIVFPASVLRIKFRQIFEDYVPRSYFFERIFHPWDRLSTRITILWRTCIFIRYIFLKTYLYFYTVYPFIFLNLWYIIMIVIITWLTICSGKQCRRNISFFFYTRDPWNQDDRCRVQRRRIESD